MKTEKKEVFAHLQESSIEDFAQSVDKPSKFTQASTSFPCGISEKEKTTNWQTVITHREAEFLLSKHLSS